MEEIIGEIIIQMESEAACGDTAELRRIASALNHLAYALRLRATAVDERLKGDVSRALKSEGMSEWGVQKAWDCCYKEE